VSWRLSNHTVHEGLMQRSGSLSREVFWIEFCHRTSLRLGFRECLCSFWQMLIWYAHFKTD